MRFGSMCSGIEAASAAWGALGWQAAWFSEIEPFACAVLRERHPEVANLGDIRMLRELVLSLTVEAPEILCGGTPCQAFSVAGLRGSMVDSRGNLSLVFCEVVNAVDEVRATRGEPPAIVLWENVVGVLSTKDNAFGCILAGLAGEDVPLVAPGGRWTHAGAVLGPRRTVAWRVLDAQHFGVAQRRKRLFVVASAREGFDPAAVLFESGGLRRDSAPRKKKGETAPTLTCRSTSKSGGLGTDFDPDGGLIHCPEIVAQAVNSKWAKGTSGPAGDEFANLIAHTYEDTALTLRAQENSSMREDTDNFVICEEQQVLPFDSTQITHAENRSQPKIGDPCHPLTSAGHPPAIAIGFNWQNGGGYGAANDGLGIEVEGAGPILRKQYPAVVTKLRVRRLTPKECERLQGFPDDYTRIGWRGKLVGKCPDGPRYRAIGNSWAVPVARWIGARIAAHVDAGRIRAELHKRMR